MAALASGDTPAEVFVISDLHIGGRYGKTPEERGFRINTHVPELTTFISEVESRARRTRLPTELVINGDIVDFLAEEGPEERPWRAFIDDEEEAVEALHAIAKRDMEVFNTLASLLASGVSLTLLLGNHDLELSRPAVRSCLRSLLKVTRTSPFQFIYDGEAYAIGDILIEHGNRYDGWNTVDFDRLRRSRSEDSRRLPVSPDAKFVAPAGSQMVEQVMNRIKKDYGFIDLLKPETEVAIPVLLALEPSYARNIERLEVVHQLQQESARRAPKAPARPSQAGNIAAGRVTKQCGTLEEVLARQLAAREQQRLLALVRDAEEQSRASAERVSGGSIRSELSFARMLFTKAWEKRLPLLLDALRAWQREGLFDWSKETESCYLEAAQELARGDFSWVIFGHTHLAKNVSLGGGRKYLNTGTWADLIRLPDRIVKGPRKEAIDHLRIFCEALKSKKLDAYVEFIPTFAHLRNGKGGTKGVVQTYEAGVVNSL